jgi:hypothetical protein
MPSLPEAASWLASAALAGTVGLAIGAVTIPLLGKVLVPLSISELTPGLLSSATLPTICWLQPCPCAGKNGDTTTGTSCQHQ